MMKNEKVLKIDCTFPSFDFVVKYDPDTFLTGFVQFTSMNPLHLHSYLTHLSLYTSKHSAINHQLPDGNVHNRFILRQRLIQVYTVHISERCSASDTETGGLSRV